VLCEIPVKTPPGEATLRWKLRKDAKLPRGVKKRKRCTRKGEGCSNTFFQNLLRSERERRASRKNVSQWPVARGSRFKRNGKTLSNRRGSLVGRAPAGETNPDFGARIRNEGGEICKKIEHHDKKGKRGKTTLELP